MTLHRPFGIIGAMDYTQLINVKELDDGSGDVYIEFPPELLNKLDWKEGDDLRFDPRRDGSIRVKKVNLETKELKI